VRLLANTGPAEAAPISIGHNGGPPLDMSFNAWAWRRAHAEAWKSPGREIVLLRIRRAARLGLGYRAYTSVILDRGVHLAGLIVMMQSSLLEFEEAVMRKLDTLHDCNVMLCTANPDAAVASLVRQKGGQVACVSPDADREARKQSIRNLVTEAMLAPASIFMVGTTEWQRQAAERSGLGLFVDASDYFGLPARKL
jgi:hypothetical protein